MKQRERRLSISGVLDGQGVEEVIAIASFKVTHFTKAKRIIGTELLHVTALLFCRCRRTQKKNEQNLQSELCHAAILRSFTLKTQPCTERQDSGLLQL